MAVRKRQISRRFLQRVMRAGSKSENLRNGYRISPTGSIHALKPRTPRMITFGRSVPISRTVITTPIRTHIHEPPEYREDEFLPLGLEEVTMRSHLSPHLRSLRGKKEFIEDIESAQFIDPNLWRKEPRQSGQSECFHSRPHIIFQLQEGLLAVPRTGSTQPSTGHRRCSGPGGSWSNE